MRHVQLRAFHHVAVCGGFSRAAEALSLTQPAVSDQVRKLEEEYDVLLFSREKRRVTLTDAGQRLLAITQRLFDAERDAAELLAETRALRAGRLRVIADSAHHLLHVLGAFRRQHPGIEIVITAGNSSEVAAALTAYKAEIGVLGEVSQHPVLRPSAWAPRRSSPLPAEAQGREAVRELVAAGSGLGRSSGMMTDWCRSQSQIAGSSWRRRWSAWPSAPREGWSGHSWTSRVRCRPPARRTAERRRRGAHQARGSQPSSAGISGRWRSAGVSDAAIRCESAWIAVSS